MSLGLWSSTPKWAEEFHEHVSAIIEDGGLTMDLTSKIPVLEDLARGLENEPECYDNVTKGSMLALWILLVTHVDQVSVVDYKYMCFRLIEGLLRRPEFRLQSLDFDFNTQDIRKDGDRELWRHINLYRKLVSDTFVYSSKLLLHENPSFETQRFCATVAAHAFFVFPLIQAPFVDVCTWRYCHHQAMHVTPLHSTLDTLVRSISLVTHTEFMDKTPDLFHWGWLTKPTDPTILPDDSSWRLLLETNDGHLFCAFVRAYHGHLATIIDASASHISVVSWEMVPGYLKLIQMFGLVLYDALTWLHSPDLPKEGALFRMTSALCDLVLDTSVLLTGNPYVIRLWAPIAVAAIKTAEPSTTTSKTQPNIKRIIQATSQWIMHATEPRRRSLSSVACNLNASNQPFQDLLLYPSYVTLQKLARTLLNYLANANLDETIAILTWIHTHMQKLPIEDKEALATSFLGQFFKLFLHWSPSVRACVHQILVYKLFRHDRRCLHLASDTAVLDAWRDQAENLAPFCFDKPAILSDSPSMILDLSLASKVDTYIFLLREPQSGQYPEALDIFVHMSLMEYGKCLNEYYEQCKAIESDLGPINWTDVIQGPNLHTLLAQNLQDNNRKHH